MLAAVSIIAGALVIGVGLFLWKKQMAQMIQPYHLKYVKEQDYPALTKEWGLGIIIIGAGMVISGLLAMITGLLWCYLIYAVAILAGIIKCIRAQRKYNKSRKALKKIGGDLWII